MKEVEDLARATLALAIEIRRELRLPEKFKAEKVLEEILVKQDAVAAMARALRGTGSPEDVALTQQILGMVKE